MSHVKTGHIKHEGARVNPYRLHPLTQLTKANMTRKQELSCNLFFTREQLLASLSQDAVHGPEKTGTGCKPIWISCKAHSPKSWDEDEAIRLLLQAIGHCKPYPLQTQLAYHRSEDCEIGPHNLPTIWNVEEGSIATKPKAKNRKTVEPIA